MLTQMRSRRAFAHTPFGLVVLFALTAMTISLVAPPGALAESPPDRRQDDYGGGQAGPNPDGQYADPADTGGAASSTSSEASGGAGATVTSDLNLRAGPSLDSEILTVMPIGSAVQTTGDPENGFYPVIFNGTSGFAYGDYLDLSGGAVPADTAASDTSADTTGLAGAGETDIVSIIYAAADAYGQSREDMLRVATCESGLDPNNVTPPYDASGLFQFLPSTWASTPFADQSVFDPVANANAAAWMWSVGRRNEWVCQ